MGAALLDQWRKIAYNEQADRGQLQRFWNEYFQIEKEIYEKLLDEPDTEVRGTVKELAEKYGQDVLTMVGFLDGINDSLKEANPIETMEEDTQVNLVFDKALLYKNMVAAKADWLYELPQWKNIYSEEELKALYKEQKESGTIRKEKKIGRNDPCPCGSGKKYKFCCLNKPADEMDLIESLEERGKCLKSYPYTGQERVEGRIYLADYFDEVSIEIDKILYLALMNRPAFIWNRNKPAEEKRMREYLYLAYQKLAARMKEEQIRTFAEYDEKYSIHYRCEEWTDSLCELLKKNYEIEKYNEVAGFIAERNR